MATPVDVDRTNISNGVLVIYYKGFLAGGSNVSLHYGYNGWASGTVKDLSMTSMGNGWWQVTVTDAKGTNEINFDFDNGSSWDSNNGLDYRRRIVTEVLDTHTHFAFSSSQFPGITESNYITATEFYGVDEALASWVEDNTITTQAVALHPQIHGLLWVNPNGGPSPAQVETYLRDYGFLGIKMHPIIDNFEADSPIVYPYMALAAKYNVPVVIHTSPGNADPYYVYHLAQLFPNVNIVMYHVYLGASTDGGRERAAGYAAIQPNLYLETSWNTVNHILMEINTAGINKVMFGSDATTDGSTHYNHNPANVEGVETYAGQFPVLQSDLTPAAFQQFMAGNAKNLFEVVRQDNFVFKNGLIHVSSAPLPSFSSMTYRSGDSGPNVTLWLRSSRGDLSSANVKYSIDGGNTYTTLGMVKNHSWGKWDFYNATLPPLSDGTTLYYRFNPVDGTNSVWLGWNPVQGIHVMDTEPSGTSSDWVCMISQTVPPAGIPNLSAVDTSNPTQVSLSWTAPGDHGMTGYLGAGSLYIIKYSTNPQDQWNSPYQVTLQAAGALPGSVSSALIPGLSKNTPYYFWIKTQDSAGLLSSLSNSATAFTPASWVTPHNIPMDGSMSGWDNSSELMDLRNGGSFYFTWSSTAVYIAYAGPDANTASMDFFVSFDTISDFTNSFGSGSAVSNWTGAESHLLPFKAGYTLSVAGNSSNPPYLALRNWTGSAWNDPGNNGGISSSYLGTTANEIAVPLASLGNPNHLRVVMFHKWETALNVYNSFPRENPAPNTAAQVQFTTFYDVGLVSGAVPKNSPHLIPSSVMIDADKDVIWGSTPLATSGSSNLPGNYARDLYVVSDSTFLYVGYQFSGDPWSDGLSAHYNLLIATGGAGGVVTDPWSKTTSVSWSNKPNLAVNGWINQSVNPTNFGGMVRYRAQGGAWDSGTSLVSGVDFFANTNNNWAELRIPRNILGVSNGQTIQMALLFRPAENKLGVSDSTPYDGTGCNDYGNSNSVLSQFVTYKFPGLSASPTSSPDQPLTPAQDFSNFIVFPNPFRPNFGDPQMGRYYSSADKGSGIVFANVTDSSELQIFTLTGQKVRTLKTVPGSGRIQWDVKNEDGNLVGTGFYFYLVKDSSGRRVTGKVAVIR